MEFDLNAVLTTIDFVFENKIMLGGVIGTFIGWNLPQPKLAVYLQAKVVAGVRYVFAKFKKFRDCLAPGTQPCCSDCGCSLTFKVRSLSSECPKGYWDALVTEDQEDLITNQINENDN